MPRYGSREVRFKAFSSAYEYVAQYPHQSSGGRRELRSAESQKERSQSGSTSTSRDRSKVNSVDTAIYAPNANGEQSAAMDRQHRTQSYSARDSTYSNGTAHRSKSIHSVESEQTPLTPDFNGFGDGTGQPVAPSVTMTPITIPTRIRQVGGFQMRWHDQSR